MWSFAEFQPTAFFSLRAPHATSSGGKSLLIPTPFALRTALLDVAIRTQGLARGKALFPALKHLTIALRLPPSLVVNKTFGRILKINDSVSKAGAAQRAANIERARASRRWPYQRNIAFREIIHYGGPLTLAFQGMDANDLHPLLLQLSYLGKRGGFMQLWRAPWTEPALPPGFTDLTTDMGPTFPLGTLQVVDDWGPGLTFDTLNIYHPSKPRRGRDRITRQIVLPCRPIRSSRSYTLYTRHSED